MSIIANDKIVLANAEVILTDLYFGAFLVYLGLALIYYRVSNFFLYKKIILNNANNYFLCSISITGQVTSRAKGTRGGPGMNVLMGTQTWPQLQFENTIVVFYNETKEIDQNSK